MQQRCQQDRHFASKNGQLQPPNKQLMLFLFTEILG